MKINKAVGKVYDSGFSLVETITTLFVLTIIVGVGLLIWSKEHKPAPPNSGLTLTSSSSWVKVKGARLINSSGKPIRLLGVDASGTEKDCVSKSPEISVNPLSGAESQAIASWHLNAVRIPLNEDCWLGINGVSSSVSGANYQTAIRNWVTNINKTGMVAILDLHFAAPGNYRSSTEWPMADESHAPTFWKQVASTFAHNPGVIFDLFNEPFLGGQHPTTSDWSCWLNGCTNTTGMVGSAKQQSSVVKYQTAGMQQLVNVVRQAGARQPIMLGGLNWAGDPCGLKSNGGSAGNCLEMSNLPKDPDGQLIIDFHTYLPNSACKDIGCWNNVYAGANKANVPIVTGEFGERDCSADFMNTYMNWADKHGVSYLAWTWNVNSTKKCLANNDKINHYLLSNWNGSPANNSPDGSAYKNHIAQLSSKGVDYSF